MAAPVVAATSKNTTTATSVSVTKPTGTVADDLLVAVVHTQNGGAGITIQPADGLTWNSIENTVNLASTWAVLWRLAGGSEPASYSFQRSDVASERMNCVMLRVTGVDTADPIGNESSDSTTAVSISALGLTTSADDSLVLSCLGPTNTRTIVSAPGGYSLADESVSFDPTISVYYEEYPTSGTNITSFDWTINSSTGIKHYAVEILAGAGGVADVEGELAGTIEATGSIAADVGVSGTLAGTIALEGEFAGEFEGVAYVGTLAGAIVVEGAFAAEHVVPDGLGIGGGGGSGGVLRHGRRAHTGAGLRQEEAHRWAELKAIHGALEGVITVTGSMRAQSRKSEWQLDEESLLELLVLDVL